MKVRIVVANENQAEVFELDGMNSPLQCVAKLEDEAARLPDRELDADRPGRSFNRMTPGRHAMDGERSTRRVHQTRLARRIAADIERARNNHQFDRLVMMAGPKMLGSIREALSDSSRKAITAQVVKDLAQFDADSIRAHIPDGVFHTIETDRST